MSMKYDLVRSCASTSSTLEPRRPMLLLANEPDPYPPLAAPRFPVTGWQQFILALVIVILCSFGYLPEGALYSVLFSFGFARS